MGKFLTLFLAAMVWANAGFAQEETTNTSNVKVDEVKPSNQPKDTDEEVTNPRMRATMGSKSRVSIRTSFAYNGGSIERPFSEIRPDYQAGAGVDDLSDLGGSIGVNYRMDNGDSIALSTGLSIQNPFHGDLTRNNMVDPRDGTSQIKRADLTNPSISWGRNYKAGGFQMQTSAGYSHYTTQIATDVLNGIGSLSLSHTVLAEFGTSGWSGGISASVSQAFYKGDAPERMGANGAFRPRQFEMGYGLYPFTEYQFNDRYAFRTVFGYFANTRWRAQQGSTIGDSAAVVADVPYQSMGLGISLTRDIYLYPNIQFAPLDIRPERSNVAMSANVNMF